MANSIEIFSVSLCTLLTSCTIPDLNLKTSFQFEFDSFFVISLKCAQLAPSGIFLVISKSFEKMSQLLQKGWKNLEMFFLLHSSQQLIEVFTRCQFSINKRIFPHFKERQRRNLKLNAYKILAFDIIMNMRFLFLFYLEVLDIMIWLISLLQKQKLLIDFLIGWN